MHNVSERTHTSFVHLPDRSEAYHNPNHIHQQQQPVEIELQMQDYKCFSLWKERVAGGLTSECLATKNITSKYFKT